MNKIDLKNSLDELYFQSLQSSNLSCISAVDSIKSILGINLQDINIELINWLEGYIDIYPSKKNNFKQPVSVPEAISFYSLEKSLSNKDYSKSIENILHLSHVSEGTQIFEFLLEFSLARSIKNFKYIWHIYRMNLFLNNKYLKYGLIKSIELIIDDFAADKELVQEKLTRNYAESEDCADMLRRSADFISPQSGDLGELSLGDMPLDLQVKLLRVLQEKKVRPVGSQLEQEVNIRVVSASHKDIVQAVKDNQFREDLYYRLNVVSITLPSLKERLDDIPLLATRFLHKLTNDDKQFNPQSITRLLSYDWPGNVRQLHNIVEHCIAISAGKIITEDVVAKALPDSNETHNAFVGLNEAKRQFEYDYIQKVLALSGFKYIDS